MFGKLFGKLAPKNKRGAPLLSQGVRASIESVVGARGIPPLQGAAYNAFQLSINPSAEVQDFIEVLESDEALSARVIKISNSVFFDRGKKTSTLEEAILMIGIEELRCILNASTLSELFPSKNPIRALLWAHDVATGIFARELARRCAPNAAETAFLAGLMHDIGKLLLLQRTPELYAKVIAHIEREGSSYREAEAEVFLFDHTEVGQLIGERWAFGEELTEAIRNHHQVFPPLAAGVTPSTSAIIYCADRIAHALGIGHPRGFFKLRSQAEEGLKEALAVIGLSDRSPREILTEYAKLYERESQLYTNAPRGG
jgi:putative nucleotidyltransferase with HDIG domain